MPARPRHPRDKPKAEVGVQVCQRWIVARLRNETHFSLASLNERIAEMLEKLNDRVMRRYGESRRQLSPFTRSSSRRDRHPPER